MTSTGTPDLLRNLGAADLQMQNLRNVLGATQGLPTGAQATAPAANIPQQPYPMAGFGGTELKASGVMPNAASKTAAKSSKLAGFLKYGKYIAVLAVIALMAYFFIKRWKAAKEKKTKKKKTPGVPGDSGASGASVVTPSVVIPTLQPQVIHTPRPARSAPPAPVETPAPAAPAAPAASAAPAAPAAPATRSADPNYTPL